MKKVVAVNCSPRTGWNTDMLVLEAARGAEEAGAVVEKFDLYRLGQYTGCLSCFGCKREGHEGTCVLKDGLTPVLEAVREADALILGTPNYLGNATAGFRALYERMLFENMTYQKEQRRYRDVHVSVLLIMTSNSPTAVYPLIGYRRALKSYQRTMGMFLGPVTLMTCGQTQQVADYSQFHWTSFNGEKRVERREKVFPKEKQKAYELGKELLKG